MPVLDLGRRINMCMQCVYTCEGVGRWDVSPSRKNRMHPSMVALSDFFLFSSSSAPERDTNASTPVVPHST